MENDHSDNQSKSDYIKIVDFMNRINATEKESVQQNIQSPKSKTNIIPRVPKSVEGIELELPDGKTVELPLLDGTVGPKVIDGR